VALIIGSLDKAFHDRAAFDCGRPPLNDFLRTKAAKHQAQRISRTFVLTDSVQPKRILGYYSLSNCQIAREDLSEQEAKALPRHPIPAVLLARLAVDQAQQGRRYGLWLLMDAIKRCALVGQQSGVYALVVDAKDDEARHFYQRYGFVAIPGRPLTLYLPLATGLMALQPLRD
jgi:GNAT superfamily N-acetyltransferase